MNKEINRYWSLAEYVFKDTIIWFIWCNGKDKEMATIGNPKKRNKTNTYTITPETNTNIISITCAYADGKRWTSIKTWRIVINVAATSRVRITYSVYWKIDCLPIIRIVQVYNNNNYYSVVGFRRRINTYIITNHMMWA